VNKAALAQQLIIDEGVKLKPYRCTAGKLTIGVGRNLDDVGITDAEAFRLLDNDLDRVLAQCRSHIPWFDAAPEEVQQVLANMAFNLGIVGLLQFKATLGWLQVAQYQKAADAMFDSKWAGQVGARAERLAERVRVLAVS
jgi:lysozyme